MENLRYWLWLTNLKGLGVRSQLRLLEQLGSPEAVWALGPNEVPPIDGITARELQAAADKNLAPAEKILADCERLGLSILTLDDPAYPERLRSIETAPPVLYCRGTLPRFDALPAVAVVGSRNASETGLAAAKRLGFELASCGGTVVSGAAKGVDSRALEGAMLAGRPVAAVLGNGLDLVYPKESKQLYHDIVESGGCLLSEYIPGTKPYRWNFPRRNRIMSGLCLGLLVVEAAAKSGTMITVDYALEQGRDVFAVPGSTGLESCQGSNRLLQEGAGLVLSGWDLMREYQFRFPELVQENHTPMPKPKPAAQPPETGSGAGRKAAKPEKSPENAKKTSDSGANQKNLIDNEKNSNYIDLEQLLPKLSPDEASIARVLCGQRLHVDELILQTGLKPAAVLAALTMMEIRGCVRQYPGKLFELKM